MLHVDIPTRPELARLFAARGPAHVSFYLPTTPETQNVEAARIGLGNLLREAEGQLEAAGTPKRVVAAIAEQVQDLLEDDDFWDFQAHSVAILVTPERLRSYRLPNRLTKMVQVADRFHLKPLIRAVSVPQHAFVLALEQNEVRLIEVFSDMPPEEIRVPDMPRDAASATGKANANSRNAVGRLQGSEGIKVRLRQYARKIDAALRPVLAGRQEPLIIVATDPLLSIWRSVSSYPETAEQEINTSPARVTPAELAQMARGALDELKVKWLAEFAELYQQRGQDGRATGDVAQAARAATWGAVDTLLVDIDEVVPGRIDETTGEVTFAEEGGADSYGVVDEIAGRVIAAGGTVIGVRRDDIPGGGSLAAVLRYAV